MAAVGVSLWPRTMAACVIGGFLMLGGLSLLAVVTAAITSGFVFRAEARRRATGDDPVIQRLDQLTKELEAVKGALKKRRHQGPSSADPTPIIDP
ncbi:MAG TPA: hypothetical protein VFB39_14795 [Solirubrobacteraceae bacterium]|nr:hypothetical protein [Solirubrobacteraceae bacterium]